jgi:hypothetical protein
MCISEVLHMTSPAGKPGVARFAATALSAALLAGCTGQEPSTPAQLVTVSPGVPPGVSTPTEVTVISDDDARQVLIVTLGSSSCPTVPVSATWDSGDQVLRVSLGSSQEGDQPCTADSAQSTSVLRLPPQAPDATDGLTVVVDDQEFAVGSP